MQARPRCTSSNLRESSKIVTKIRPIAVVGFLWAAFRVSRRSVVRLGMRRKLVPRKMLIWLRKADQAS